MNPNKATPITKEKIVSASWDLLRSDGIENFTMRKLAKQLDIKAASLYWHFPSKQNIFQYLANEIAKKVLLSVRNEEDWKAALYQFGMHFREQLEKYPCSAQLMMQTLPSEPEYLALINAMLIIVDPLPLSDRDKFSAIACMLNYVLSFELDRYQQKKVNLAMQQDGMEHVQKQFANAMDHLPDHVADPLRRMHRNQIFSELGSISMFQTGLTILISGIEQLSLARREDDVGHMA